MFSCGNVFALYGAKQHEEFCMRNLYKLIGIIALVAAIGFSFVSCDTGGGDDGGGDNKNNNGDSTAANLGNELTLSDQQVYTGGWNGNTYMYMPFTENLTVVASHYDYTTDNSIPIGGSGAITNGKLNYTIKTPSSLRPIINEFIYGFDGDGWDNFQAIPSDTKCVFLRLTVPNGNLRKGNFTVSESGNTSLWTEEGVGYIYVDKDVTITGRGTTVNGTYDYDYLETYTWTAVNLNLALKAGWNALHFKESGSATFTPSIGNPTSANSTYTNTLTLGDPNFMWELY
jgi:hypothetical protein